jgi:hypothetical protein
MVCLQAVARAVTKAAIALASVDSDRTTHTLQTTYACRNETNLELVLGAKVASLAMPDCHVGNICGIRPSHD